MTAAIRDDNPVILFHNYLLTLEHGDVPEGEHVVPIGEAAVAREGADVTIVGIGWTVGKALAAASSWPEGIDAEVVDPRSLAPLDTATIIQSVEKTGGSSWSTRRRGMARRRRSSLPRSHPRASRR